MQRAIQLAKNGLGAVSPNPMVGCVVVHNDKIIGEGWHQKFGQEHAEVNAINSVEQKALLKESIVYVTLEPCSFHGKTPACSDLIIRSKVKKVIIATLDPNPKVSGKGMEAINSAGIEVEVGILEIEAIELNRRFFINQKLKRPYVILKWAQTKDGFIARKNFDSKWISNEFSRQFVHRWRAEEDAILVGKNTAKHDNPSLTVREWYGRNPLRIVLDRKLELNTDLNLFNGEVQTIIYNSKENKKNELYELVKIESDNFLSDILINLLEREVGSVIIEGGSQILNNFIKANLWDEARIFTSIQEFEDGFKAPSLEEKLSAKESIHEDELSYYYNPQTKVIWQKN